MILPLCYACGASRSRTSQLRSHTVGKLSNRSGKPAASARGIIFGLISRGLQRRRQGCYGCPLRGGAIRIYAQIPFGARGFYLCLISPSRSGDGRSTQLEFFLTGSPRKIYGGIYGVAGSPSLPLSTEDRGTLRGIPDFIPSAPDSIGGIPSSIGGKPHGKWTYPEA
jgi:hypothetical protein